MRFLVCLTFLASSAIPSFATVYSDVYARFHSGAIDLEFHLPGSLGDRAEYYGYPYYSTNFELPDGLPDVFSFFELYGGPYNGGPGIGLTSQPEELAIFTPGSGPFDPAGYAGTFPGTVTVGDVLNRFDFVPGVYDYVGGRTGESATLTISDHPFAPVTQTPEPSAFVLLGTGALGLAGAMKRRMKLGR